MTKELTVKDPLKAIVKEATAALEGLREHGFKTFKGAVRFGSAMNEAKRVIPRGGFLEWLHATFHDVSQRTAYNYMELAKFAVVAQLSDDIKLREAYRLARILPDWSPKVMPALPQHQDDVVDVEVVTRQEQKPECEKPDGTCDCAKEILDNCAPAVVPLGESPLLSPPARVLQDIAVANAVKFDETLERYQKDAIVAALSVADGPPPQVQDDTLTAERVQRWVDNTTEGGTWLYKREVKAAANAVASLPKVCPPTVTAWAMTAEGQSWLKDFNNQHAGTKQEPLQDGRGVRIITGPPFTLAHLKTGLEQLTALIPNESDHDKFADLLSTFAAKQLVLARDRNKKGDPMSAYTR